MSVVGMRRVLRAAGRVLDPGANPAGLVYGTIAVGAVLAAEAPKRETFASTLEATLLTLGLYWFAHTYAAVVGRRLEQEERLTARRVAGTFLHEWAIVRGALVPIVVLLVAWAGGVGLTTGVTAALWASAAVLALAELLAAVRGAGTRRRRGVEASLGFLFGACLLLVHVLLH